MKIIFYPAGMGDCFLLDFEDTLQTKFVIDCGQKKAFQSEIYHNLHTRLNSSNNYLFLSHIDDDHIGGLVYILEKKPDFIHKFKKVFYNTFDYLNQLTPSANNSAPSISIKTDLSGKTSYTNAKLFEQFALDNGLVISSGLTSLKTMNINDIHITFLSPSITTLQRYKSWADIRAFEAGKTASPSDYSESIDDLLQKSFSEDTSPTNGSSISLLIEYKEYKLLFLGDSFPSDVTASLKQLGYSLDNKIKLNVMKVSHHGSKHSTSNELLRLINCEKFLISTNGKQQHHPDKETLARIINSQCRPCFIFNYDRICQIFNDQELASQHFDAIVKKEVDI